MTKTNSSTYPKVDRVKAVQSYLESGDIPMSVLSAAWNTSDCRRVVKLVDAHYNLSEADAIGLEVVVRDAMQNMALAGAFPEGVSLVTQTENQVMHATNEDVYAVIKFLVRSARGSLCD